ncbi:MAG: conjugal transfer protein TraH [Erythrobacter sp.]
MSNSEKSFYRRGFRIVGGSLTCLAAISLVVTPAAASVEGEMNSYFNSAGAAANVTGPAAFDGQSAGYYSGGSLWTRFPTKQINPVNLQLPRASGGCGGIDLFGGSFSFINTDEIVATLKATANNAIGFAFQLAIDSISAQIGGVMKDMSHKIQQLNQFNMNSCQLAQEAVGAIWPKMDGASQTICQNLGRSSGLFSDEAKARHECQDQSARNSAINGSTDPQAEIAKSKNYTWNALMENSATRPDEDYAEWLMTMVGTIIYVKPESEAATNGGFQFIAPASWDTYTALLDGTAVAPAQIYRCDTSAADGCLNPVATSLNVGPNSAYKARVRTMMQSIAGKIRANTMLSNDEVSLLGMSSVPIYKILVVNEASQFGIGAGELDSLAEIVAVEVLLGNVDRMLDDVLRSQVGFNTPEQQNFTSWRKQVQDVRDNLESKRAEMSGKLNDTYQIIQRTQHLEATLKNTMSPQISASLRFGRGLSAQGIR